MSGLQQHKFLLLVLAAIWLVSTACSCGDLVSDITAGRQPTSTPIAVTRVVRRATATPDPTQTPTRTPVPTPKPFSTLLVPTKPPKPPAQPGGSVQVPTQPNKDFIIEATQDEINDYLAGETFEQQGLEVREIKVTLTAREIIGELKATYAEMNLSAGATMRGVPSVVDGEVYFKITDVELDDSISGLARIVAKVAVEEAIAQYSTPYGIPITIEEDVEVLDIQLLPGKLIIKGRTR